MLPVGDSVSALVIAARGKRSEESDKSGRTMATDLEWMKRLLCSARVSRCAVVRDVNRSSVQNRVQDCAIQSLR